MAAPYHVGDDHVFLRFICANNVGLVKCCILSMTAVLIERSRWRGIEFVAGVGVPNSLLAVGRRFECIDPCSRINNDSDQQHLVASKGRCRRDFLQFGRTR
jgi:hypothetical protein